MPKQGCNNVHFKSFQNILILASHFHTTQLRNVPLEKFISVNPTNTSMNLGLLTNTVWESFN